MSGIRLAAPALALLSNCEPIAAELCWKSDIVADILVGVFNTCPDRPMLVEVVSDAKLGRPRIRHSDAEVLILVVRESQIGGHRANAVRLGVSQLQVCPPKTSHLPRFAYPK